MRPLIVAIQLWHVAARLDKGEKGSAKRGAREHSRNVDFHTWRQQNFDFPHSSYRITHPEIPFVCFLSTLLEWGRHIWKPQCLRSISVGPEPFPMHSLSLILSTCSTMEEWVEEDGRKFQPCTAHLAKDPAQKSHCKLMQSGSTQYMSWAVQRSAKRRVRGCEKFLPTLSF